MLKETSHRHVYASVSNHLFTSERKGALQRFTPIKRKDFYWGQGGRIVFGSLQHLIAVMVVTAVICFFCLAGKWKYPAKLKGNQLG